MENRVQVIGMVWYSEEDFLDIKAMMVDRNTLHTRYVDWKAAAENGERQLRGKGIEVVRAHLKPAAFKEWCVRHGHDLNAQGRNAFANWCAMQAHTQNKH